MDSSHFYSSIFFTKFRSMSSSRSCSFRIISQLSALIYIFFFFLFFYNYYLFYTSSAFLFFIFIFIIPLKIG